MIRRDVDIALVEISPADVRAAVDAHQLSLDWSGDSFMADHWLAGEHRAVVVDGAPVGVTGWGEAGLSPAAPRAAGTAPRPPGRPSWCSRESGARTAYVASWDAHHLAVLGAFATGIASQAYQFRLVDADDLRQPLPGLTLALATHADLGYLESTGWQDDVASFVERNAMSVVRLDGQEVGIAVHEPHALDPRSSTSGCTSTRCCAAAASAARSSPSRPARCWPRDVPRSPAAGGRTGRRGSPSRPPA